MINRNEKLIFNLLSRFYSIITGKSIDNDALLWLRCKLMLHLQMINARRGTGSPRRLKSDSETFSCIPGKRIRSQSTKIAGIGETRRPRRCRSLTKRCSKPAHGARFRKIFQVSGWQTARRTCGRISPWIFASAGPFGEMNLLRNFMSGINIPRCVAAFRARAAAAASLGVSRTVKIFHYLSARNEKGGELERNVHCCLTELLLRRRQLEQNEMRETCGKLAKNNCNRAQAVWMMPMKNNTIAFLKTIVL